MRVGGRQTETQGDQLPPQGMSPLFLAYQPSQLKLWGGSGEEGRENSKAVGPTLGLLMG